jgi:hypothetical protein
VLVLAVVGDTRAEAEGWDGPLWKELRPLHGYDSTDTQPLHDETTSLHEATGLRVVIPAGKIRFGSFRAVAPTDRDVARVLEAAEEGVADYPSGFLQQIGLRGLAVTRDLHEERRRLEGVSFSNGYIAVDALASFPGKTFHHEVFHAIEVRHDLPLQKWGRLNPVGFEYAGDSYAGRAPRPYCFVTPYGTKEAKEDRADSEHVARGALPRC